MISLPRSLIIAALIAIGLPAIASAQILPPAPYPYPYPTPAYPAYPYGGYPLGLGLGIGLTQQQQLGPPPAGVLLHQQYMQLYGLPTSFQGSINNGGRAGILPGAYGGYPGYGGIPRYFGANYQRNLAAMQAAQVYASAQGNYGSFGLSGGTYQPTFNQSPLNSTVHTAPQFSGFGLSNTANPFIPSTANPSNPYSNEKNDGDKREDK
jgi:hypothetical protein